MAIKITLTVYLHSAHRKIPSLFKIQHLLDDIHLLPPSLSSYLGAISTHKELHEAYMIQHYLIA